MPSYIVTLKDGVKPEEKQQVKDDVKSQGGSVDHEYTLINGLAVSYPTGHVGTLENHPHVNTVELDGEVKTQ